jgi:hypothetical protein
MSKDETVFSWEVDEYIERERSNDWFWTVGLIVLTGIVISIILKNFVFAMFLAVAAGTLSVFIFRKPERLEITIDSRGVQVHHNFYPFKEIKQFWVEPEEGGQNGIRQVFFLTSQTVIPEISIELTDDVDADALQSYLLRKIPEGEIKESLAHQVMESLGF